MEQLRRPFCGRRCGVSSGQGEGTLNIEAGGVVSNTTGNIGYWSDAVGTVTVTGEESEWNNSHFLYVGRKGKGTLNIEAGGVVSNTRGYIGYSMYQQDLFVSSSVGTVTVTGEGSEWNNSDWLSVGHEGEGTLNIKAGGVVSNTGGSIGSSSGSVGTVTVTGEGSQWNNSGSLTVSNGTLNITDGGMVSNTTGHIGSSSNSVATVTVTGEGSEWNNSGGLTMGSGWHSNGTLNITNGGVVSNTTGHIGYDGDSVGTVTVTGEESE